MFGEGVHQLIRPSGSVVLQVHLGQAHVPVLVAFEVRRDLHGRSDRTRRKRISS
jgi:hypothetical protein